MNGLKGQFCSEACMQGTPCAEPTHTVPSIQSLQVADPREVGGHAPCVRAGCACAVEGGSSWDGNPGHFCCRACRNGTPCTKLSHRYPDAVAAERAETRYGGNQCALEGCSRPTWNGSSNGFCCAAHQRMQFGQVVVEDALKQRLRESEPLNLEYDLLWEHAEQWARAHGSGATKGAITKVLRNTSICCAACPARLSFEAAARRTGFESWSDGEFAWHGTKSLDDVLDICWNGWDPRLRTGQEFGAGEYFSRGTLEGLHYGESYAGGTAGHLLIVGWVMPYHRGGAPVYPENNGAGHPSANGHIVCNNQVPSGSEPIHEKYCIPVAVVAFGELGAEEAKQLQFQDVPSSEDLVRLKSSTMLTLESMTILRDMRAFSCNDFLLAALRNKDSRVLRWAMDQDPARGADPVLILSARAALRHKGALTKMRAQPMSPAFRSRRPERQLSPAGKPLRPKTSRTLLPRCSTDTHLEEKHLKPANSASPKRDAQPVSPYRRPWRCGVAPAYRDSPGGFCTPSHEISREAIMKPCRREL